MSIPLLEDIPCVILCGGKSSRMKEDKALLPFHNKDSLAKYQYDRLKPYFKKVYISSKSNKFDFLKDENLILDKNKTYSPISALEAIFENIDEEKVFILTVDTPLIQIETIKKIIENSFDKDISVAKTSRLHNLCGLFKKERIKPVIKKMLEEDFHKVGFLLQNLSSHAIECEDENEFINLNEKKDYKKALELISLDNKYY